jgi:signal transduction protein with GAF and PtsI domain
MANKNIESIFSRIIETIDVSKTLTEPLSDSIENLLKLAASSMKSEEASIIVRNGDTGEIKFLAAIGKVADQLIGLKMPGGKGIAGFVFSTGQPMAVADVGQEESFYDEFDKKTGFETQTILATPLRYNGEVIGVLEFINRIGEPPFEPFTPFEMDKAALFADAIASLVNAYENAEFTECLCERFIKDEGDIASVKDWMSELRTAPEHKEMFELAMLVRAVSKKGEAERNLCKEILESFLRYSDDNTDTSFLNF